LVEQKPDKAERYGLQQREAVTYLETLGGRAIWESHGDHIVTFGHGLR
jgi:hypothetical protein